MRGSAVFREEVLRVGAQVDGVWPGVGRRGLAAFSEERLEDGGAVGGEDARGDFYMMV